MGNQNSRSAMQEDNTKVCLRLHQGGPCEANHLSHHSSEPVPAALVGRISQTEWSAFIKTVEARVPRRGAEVWLQIVGFVVGLLLLMVSDCLNDQSGETSDSCTPALQYIGLILMIGTGIGSALLTARRKTQTRATLDELASEHQSDMLARSITVTSEAMVVGGGKHKRTVFWLQLVALPQPPAVVQAYHHVSVPVPAGTTPGTTLNVAVPGGGYNVAAVVPEGVASGGAFQIALPQAQAVVTATQVVPMAVPVSSASPPQRSFSLARLHSTPAPRELVVVQASPVDGGGVGTEGVATERP